MYIQIYVQASNIFLRKTRCEMAINKVECSCQQKFIKIQTYVYANMVYE